MKWLFFILLIANLGLFIWLFPQWGGGERSALPVEDIGQLLLVGEIVNGEPDVKADASADSQSLSIAAQAQRRTAAPVVEPEESPQVPPIVVSDTATSPDVATEELSTETPQAPAMLICGRVGVFDKRSQAELLSVRMLAQGAKTEITSESSNEQSGFWVLIPAQKDRKAAIAIAKRLEAAGVSDLWRFTSGNLAHAISLGLFRDEERAQARMEQIAELGFNAEILPRYRERAHYWLNYRYTGATPISHTRWQEIREQYPEIQRKELPCP